MNRFGVSIVFRRGYASASNASFRAADTIVKKTDRPNAKPDPEKLVFGASYSDHMLTIKHTTESGWEKPLIEPLKNLSIHPGAKVLHYATEVSNETRAHVVIDHSRRHRSSKE
jgi:branched-chain amino acid aminotransferase